MIINKVRKTIHNDRPAIECHADTIDNKIIVPAVMQQSYLKRGFKLCKRCYPTSVSS